MANGGDIAQAKIIQSKARRRAIALLIQNHNEEFMKIFRTERKEAAKAAGLPSDIFSRMRSNSDAA